MTFAERVRLTGKPYRPSRLDAVDAARARSSCRLAAADPGIHLASGRSMSIVYQLTDYWLSKGRSDDSSTCVTCRLTFCRLRLCSPCLVVSRCRVPCAVAGRIRTWPRRELWEAPLLSMVISFHHFDLGLKYNSAARIGRHCCCLGGSLRSIHCVPVRRHLGASRSRCWCAR